MDKTATKKRIERLKRQFRDMDYAYFVLDKPIVSDAVRDSLKAELTNLEHQFPNLVTPDSPTQRIGGRADGKFDKIRHKVAKYSLDDVFSFDEVLSFDARAKKNLALSERSDLEYSLELKIDGLNISILYKKGIFDRAVTRGDGKVGEDVTHTIKTIASIPLKLKDEVDIEVGGEVFMPIKSFEKLNKYSKQKFANPRNAAAGTVRQLDPAVAASRDLHAFFYSINSGSLADIKTQLDLLKYLQFLGFPVEHHFHKVSSINGVKKFFDQISKKRDKLGFQIDGIVTKINNLDFQARLGRTAKSVRWAAAYKFAAEQATTIVEDIQIQVGRTGTLTPVAHLKPVFVDGSTVSRATLHNEDEIKRLGIKIGDTVVIQKAGDVIPDILEVLFKLRSGKEKSFHMPANCPICSSKVERKAGESAYRCTNLKCYAQSKQNLYHFVSRGALNVDGLGPKIIDQLLDEGLVKDVSDFFSLTKGDLEPLERFGKKATDNLIAAIEDSKAVSLSRFIYSLGIRNVGEQTAIDLAKHFGSIDDLRKAPLDSLERISDVGPVVAKSIFNYFSDQKNIELVDKLLSSGLNPKDSTASAASQKLSGKTFVLTGSLDSMSRAEAKQKIRDLGGNVSSSVSASTDYLLAGDDPGSKYDKAKKLGVKIINQKEFLGLI
jgi:DNA ligase (NAD+)